MRQLKTLSVYTEALVKDYIKFGKKRETNKAIMDTFKKFVPTNSSVLEFGSALGFDYNILQEDYQIIGSDYSPAFIEYLKQNFDDEFYEIDLLDFKINYQFEVLYSNKVMIHFDPLEIRKSLKLQLNALEPGGIAIHTFWFGAGHEYHNNLHFYNYTMEIIEDNIQGFEILEIKKYKEFKEGDSIIVVLRKPVNGELEYFIPLTDVAKEAEQEKKIIIEKEKIRENNWRDEVDELFSGLDN